MCRGERSGRAKVGSPTRRRGAAWAQVHPNGRRSNHKSPRVRARPSPMAVNPLSNQPGGGSGQGSHVAHLRGLLEVTAVLRGDQQLSALLDAIARAVCDALGFGTVVITLYRPAWNDFEVTA